MTPALTTAQLQTLKSFINADPVLSLKPMNDDGDFDIAAALNQPNAVSFLAWKSSVNLMEVTGRPGFDWTRVDNLSVGKARIWEWLFLSHIANPSFASVRSGVEATFAVEATDAPCRQAFYDASVRQVSTVEKLYATGTGTAPTSHGVNPGSMASEGPISAAEVHQARALP